MVVMTRYSYIQISRGLGRRKDREQHRDSAPVGKEVSLVVVGPWILAVGVVALDIASKCHFIVLASELT